jgi:putative ABC transport system permease protein
LGFWQALRMALKSIRANKVRSFLTMLGVIIGVASVITAVAFAQGSTKSITDSIQSLGTNLIQISINNPRGSSRNLTFKELQAFAEEHASEITAIAPTINSSMTVKVGKTSASTTIIGTNQDYEIIKDTHVREGRFLLDIDSVYRQKIAVIGSYVAKEFYPDSDPLGQTIKLNGNVLTVVGILVEKAGSQVSSEDDQILIPVTLAQRLTKNANLRNFSIKSADTGGTDKIMADLNAFMLTIYSSTSAFRVFNQAQLLSTLSGITGTLMIVLGGIAGISLFVGGIGIMNIMLVSVTERTREIGIRKAIGAKRRSILTQFLIEAIVVTGLGGLIGVAIGLGAIYFIIGGLKIVPAVYSLPWILVAFGISLTTGIIFGMFPAIKASNLNPIEALRSE